MKTRIPRSANGFASHATRHFAAIHAVLLGFAAAAQAGPDGEALLTADKTFWELYQQGGFMMWVMLVVSMFALSLIIESAVRLREKVVAPAEHFEQLRLLFRQGNYVEAWRVASVAPSPFARVIAAGLEMLGQGKEAVREALEEHAHKEALMMRTRVNYLSVIGVVSPMLGLIGTVVGMIKAFQEISRLTSNPAGLSEAIGEVLVATAFGLFIAVPAFFAYYFFRNRAQVMIVLMQDKATRLMRGVPYELLQGVRIGSDWETEPPATTPTPMILAPSQCPHCSYPLAAGATPCPRCGVQLSWN